MFNSRRKKAYVVFNGKKPSIYDNWVDCHAQVNRFKDNVYKSFETMEEANASWENFCDTGFIHSQTNKDGGSISSPSATIAGDDDGVRQYVDHGPGDFVIEYNMQRLLQKVCACRGIQPPSYTYHSSMVISGQQYYRYYASLAKNAIGAPAVSMGRFANTEDQAREEVAVSLLRRILASDGSKICDYNYYNVEIMEAQIETLNSQKFELQMENAMLLEQLHVLRYPHV